MLVGTATKFADRIHEATKVYDALVRFGAETATDDREGVVTRQAAVPTLVPGSIEPAVATLRGVIAQVPPQYAALKVGGRPAYARARGGETVALAARSVQVYRLDVIEIAPPDLRLLVVCSSGTYVRSIARDLGRALGSAAHLAALRRIAVGALEAHDAVSPDELRARRSGQGQKTHEEARSQRQGHGRGIVVKSVAIQLEIRDTTRGRCPPRGGLLGSTGTGERRRNRTCRPA